MVLFGQYSPLMTSPLRPKLAARVERLLFSKPAVQIKDLGNSDGPLSAVTSTGRILAFMCRIFVVEDEMHAELCGEYPSFEAAVKVDWRC